MKTRNLHFTFFLFLSISISIFAQEKSSFQYISPLPDSKLLSRETNIIFSHSELIDQSSLLTENVISVIGSQSGTHAGELILSDDNKTVLFNPDLPFDAGETVTVTLFEGIKTLSGKSVETESYSFSITPLNEPIWIDPVERLDLGFTTEDLRSMLSPVYAPALDSLPPDFPEITVGTVNNPAPGNVFVSNVRFGGTDSSGFFIMILDNTGYPVKYKRVAPIAAFDFKVHPNGLLSYADIFQFFGGYSTNQFKILDTSLTVIDSVQCGNGYLADLHDFLILPNGHYMLFAYDPQPVDMSEIIAGGDPNAIVFGGVIQELDLDRNVVFQWRSWDYIPITDSYSDLLSSTIDYVHLNAIELDDDGDIMFIGRSLSEVTKISRQTGEIIWRLSGKQNEFTFIGEDPSHEPHYFARPHDIRRINNRNITLFDNGDWHNPPHSRGVEYELDEVGKTATLVWEYRQDPDIYSRAMGSMQRLPNGNSLIGWGFASINGDPVLTEVHPDGTVAFELFFPLELASYRSFRFPWVSGLPAATVIINEVLQGNTYTFNDQDDTTGTKIKFNYLETILYNIVEVNRYEYAPNNPAFEERTPVIYPAHITVEASGIDSLNIDVWFNVNQIPQILDPENTTVYHRPSVGAGTFSELPTTYLPGSNELKVSGVGYAGEFIFGYPDIPVVPTIPELVSPFNNQRVNQQFPLELEWSPTGFADKFHLQVSIQQNFTSPVVDDSNLTSLTYTLTPLLQEQDYFWRVKSKNLAGWGGWSEVWSFTSTASFLDLVFPNGGEEWTTDTSMAVQWDHNLMDSVKVELYKNDVPFRVITDSLFSFTGGYRWIALDSIPDGSDYKVKVSTLDGSFSDMSENNFTIIYIPVSVEEISGVATEFNLEQNYPNPFNPGTTIRYSVPIHSQVTVKIYNSIGEQIAEIVNLVQNAGTYRVDWVAENVASGIYFYSMSAVPTDGSEIYYSVKKMILLK